jgi:hypothetical protein
MSGHEHERDERDELDLDTETVRDLEVPDDDTEQIKGGTLINCETRQPN